jgi:hypothetical protein
MLLHLKPKKISEALAGLLIACILGLAFLNSCHKDDTFETSPNFKLAFSDDTIVFDTVFTTLGSVTRQLHVYNHGDKPVKISSVKLARGESSPFRLNIDGHASLEVTNLELRANDSLYIFIKVTINPNNASNPLIESDSILFSVNGEQQDVDLVAWGQDAYFFNNTILTNDFVFANDKPNVIYGSLTVDSLHTLTILEGARIYLHKDAEMIIKRDASLKVYGSLENPVIFRGDRLEMEYDSLPGQWGRIWLSPGSRNNEINYAVIRNGYIGLQVESIGITTEPSLLLSNTVIKNMTYYGLFAQTALIKAVNCVFDGCGGNSIALTVGGNYDFRHCTVGNYWTYSARQSPSILISNFYTDDIGVHSQDLENAYFGNCIIYGNNEEEISLQKQVSAAYHVTFDHCLLHTSLTTNAPANFTDCIKNKEPNFKNNYKHNFELDSLSPAKNAGSLTIMSGAFKDIHLDIKGNSRTIDNNPDLGAYERLGGK